MLNCGELTLQTPSGKVMNIVLESHTTHRAQDLTQSDVSVLIAPTYVLTCSILCGHFLLTGTGLCTCSFVLIQRIHRNNLTSFIDGIIIKLQLLILHSYFVKNA